MGAVFTDHLPRNVPKLAFDLTDRFGPALALPLGAGEAISGVLLTVRLPGSPVFDESGDCNWWRRSPTRPRWRCSGRKTQVAQRELEVLEDRDRIARDLHDHVIQRLFAVGLAMQSTHRREKSPRQAARLAEHIDQLHDVIQEIRTSIFDLQADPADAKSLRNGVQELITELTEESGIRTTVRMGGPVNAVPPTLGQHTLAVVREAVSNAVRHAAATEVVITVSVGKELVIEVIDDGAGIPPTVARSGLLNLETRATEVGGACTVSLNNSGGTRVVWSAPLQPS